MKPLIDLDVIAAAALALGPCIEYADIPDPWKDVEMGRTKNGIATVVTAAMARELYDGSAYINVEAQKHLWPDAEGEKRRAKQPGGE